MAAGPPYGESLCFTGRRGGRKIIARSYNFFHFYVRRRNLTRRNHAVDLDRTVAVRSTCGRLAYALIFVIKLRLRQERPAATVRHHLKGHRTAAVFLSP